jgi:hypothetical protein
MPQYTPLISKGDARLDDGPQLWQRVAQRYGVSDVAIAKACTLLNIPKPPRGY